MFLAEGQNAVFYRMSNNFSFSLNSKITEIFSNVVEQRI